MKKLLFLTAILITNLTIAQVPNLIGYWPFNGNANDESTNGNNGTVNGAVLAPDRLGNANKAYDFNFNTTKRDISVAHKDIFNLNGAFTLSVWVSFDAIGVHNPVISKMMSSGNYTGWIFDVLIPSGSSTPSLRILLNGNTPNWANYLSKQASFTFSTAQFYHIVATHDGTFTEAGLKLYVNGIELTNYSNHSTLSGNSIVNTCPIKIGNADYSSKQLEGIIDEVSIYNSVLTTQEIISLSKFLPSLNDWQASGNDLFYYNGSGNVGIGCTPSATTKLAVDGKINAKEVVVTATVPSSDYVFESDYKLPNLSEVENFVITNKHLPDVPSAKEFKEQGCNVGQMQDVLLKKVEELTLYTIEQNKSIEELKQIVKLQNDKIEKLESASK